MLGALVGDCLGSFWERSYNKTVFPSWWVPASNFTDDSICTAATALWLIAENHSVEEYSRILRETVNPYMDRGFAKMFRNWAQNPTQGAYGSWANGAAMRVSPVALWAKDEAEVLSLAEKTALVTHNSEQGIRGAQATAWAIWYLLHKGKAGLLQAAAQKFDYPELEGLDPDEVRPEHIFDVSCRGTVPLALAIALRAKSFDHGIAWCCSMGGDSDTLAAIAGPLLELIFGIPEQHVTNTRLRFANEHSVLLEAVDFVYGIAPEKSHASKWILQPGQVVDATGEVVKPSKYKIFT